MQFQRIQWHYQASSQSILFLYRLHQTHCIQLSSNELNGDENLSSIILLIDRWLAYKLCFIYLRNKVCNLHCVQFCCIYQTIKARLIETDCSNCYLLHWKGPSFVRTCQGQVMLSGLCLPNKYLLHGRWYSGKCCMSYASHIYLIYII